MWLSTFVRKKIRYLFLYFLQLRKHIRASEQKIVDLKDEIDSGKLLEMSLAKSRSLCEAQMKMLDKKYNGKNRQGVRVNIANKATLHIGYFRLDLAIEHKEVIAQLKNMESILRENRSETMDLKKERDDYKNQLKLLCGQHKQYQLRESTAHTKIQDAIQMVETAMAEKDAALQREKEIRGKLTLSLCLLVFFSSKNWNEQPTFLFK